MFDRAGFDPPPPDDVGVASSSLSGTKAAAAAAPAAEGGRSPATPGEEKSPLPPSAFVFSPELFRRKVATKEEEEQKQERSDLVSAPRPHATGPSPHIHYRRKRTKKGSTGNNVLF